MIVQFEIVWSNFGRYFAWQRAVDIVRELSYAAKTAENVGPGDVDATADW